MARVTLSAGITSISGKLGNMYFRTMKATGKTYMHSLPQKRTIPLRQREIEVRERFVKRAQLVTAMRRAGSKLPKKKLWQIASEIV